MHEKALNLLQYELNHFTHAIDGGKVKWGLLILILVVNVCPSLKQQSDTFGVPLLRSHMDGKVVIDVVDLQELSASKCLEEGLDYLWPVLLCSMEQCCPILRNFNRAYVLLVLLVP